LARAAEAERRGRAIDPTVEAYEAAIREGGVLALYEGLVARANTRWENLAQNIGFPASICLPRIVRSVVVDGVLLSLGLPYEAGDGSETAPAALGDGWLGHVRWGADSIVEGARLLILCQPIGAAALVRQQLERWTFNRANALGMSIGAQESKADFIERVWQHGLDVPWLPGRIYRALSELLHGRGELATLAAWEATELAAWPITPEAMLPIVLIAEAGNIVLRQLVACCLDLAARAARPELTSLLLDWPRTVDPAETEVTDRLRILLPPLVAGALTAPTVMPLLGAEQVYLEVLTRLSAPELQRPPLSALSMLHRRHRATQGAIWALDQERQALGDLDLANLGTREVRYVVANEAASLVALWSPGPGAQALAIAANSARSSWQLWLEDDSRAMITVRTTVESVARARAWRTKPKKATRLDARGSSTSTRDWLEAAGWRRLAIWNDALGELGHSSYDARWSGAINALESLSDRPVAPEHLHFGRGDTLDRVAFLLAAETLAYVRGVAPGLADPMRKVFGIPPDPEEVIDAWLERAWRSRDFDLGAPSFAPIDLDALAALGIDVDDAHIGRVTDK
jgi:hypothetical protein